MPRGLVGLTHGCVVWGDASDEESSRPTVWTEDGLYVDELLRVPTDKLCKEEYGEENTNEYPTGHLAEDSSGRISLLRRFPSPSGDRTLRQIVPRTEKADGLGAVCTREFPAYSVTFLH